MCEGKGVKVVGHMHGAATIERCECEECTEYRKARQKRTAEWMIAFREACKRAKEMGL